MRRRNFLTATGACLTVGVAGCSDQDDDDSSSRADLYDNQNDDEETENKGEDNNTEEERLKPRTLLTSVDIYSITDDTLKLDMFVRTASQPFEIQVYETITNKSNVGEWHSEKFVPSYSGHISENSEGEAIWSYYENDDDGNSLVVKHDDIGEEVDSITFEETDYHDPEEQHIQNVERVEQIDSGRFPDTNHWRVEFDIPTPPTNKPFVYSFVVEDYEHNTRKVESRTQQILKLSNGEYIYPDRPSSQDYLNNSNMYGTHPHWNREDILRNEKDGSTRRIVRASGLSRFGDYDQYDAYTKIPTSDEMFNSERLRLWGFEYDITQDEIDDVTRNATTLTRETGDYNDFEDFRAVVNDERHYNNEIIQRVGDKLHEQCERIGMTKPYEKVRVVLDFIQHMEYEKSLTTTPAQTLKDLKGDCKHLSLLAYSLLKHEKFGFNPTLGLFMIDELGNSDAIETEAGAHVGVGVPYDELSDLNSNYIDESELSFVADGSVMGNQDDTIYMYLELTAPTVMGSLGVDQLLIPRDFINEPSDLWE